MTPTLSIIDAIARHCSLSRHQILAKDRHRSVALARHVAMYCARNFIVPAPSLPEIGRAFVKDHTSVISALKRIERQKSDPWIAAAIEVGRRAAMVAMAPAVHDVSPFYIPDLLPAAMGGE